MQLWFLALKASGTSSEAALRVRPQPLDHARVVVAVRQVVIQGGKQCFWHVFFHSKEGLSIEVEMLDVAPIVGRGIHGEARRHRTEIRSGLISRMIS